MNSPELRAGDADRDRVIEQLREAYAEGRLTTDELDQRIDAAHQARTMSDLTPLTADLPAPVPAPVDTDAVEKAQQKAKVAKDLRSTWAAWLGVGVLVNIIWLATGLTSSGFGYYWPIWVIGPWGGGLLIWQLTYWFGSD